MAAAVRDWPAYYDRVAGEPPRKTLLEAVEAFANARGPETAGAGREPLLAVDLGCGDGRDTQALLERGWSVIACDPHEEGLRRLRLRPLCALAEREGRLKVQLADFKASRFGRVDLVNASFALPFCPPEDFSSVWKMIDESLTTGGRFSGQLFGDRDSWVELGDRTHLTRAQVMAMFDRYVLENFREEDRASTYTDDAHKHWHVYHIVARKR